MRVIAIARYPVKSFQGEALSTAHLAAQGIDGDRRWGVVDGATEKVVSAKTEARLLEGEARTTAGEVEVRMPGTEWLKAGDPAVDDALSSWLGRPMRLERAETNHERDYKMPFPGTVDGREIEVPCPPGTFFDLAPVHVLTQASLRMMDASAPASTWSVARFRPTLVVEADGEGFVEDAWVGHHIHVGEAILNVFMPTVRCAMTTRAQPMHGLERDVEVVKAINHENSSNLGVYAGVERAGNVAIGDDLHLEKRH